MISTRIGMMVTVLSLSARLLAAQQPGPPKPPGNAGGMMGDTAMAQRQQMRMMDSMTTRLDSLVGRMNKATGNTKVAAMADVINELVAQRKAMQAHMRRMMESRQGMMEHMMGGQPRAGQPQPPALADSSAADSGHAGHHPKP